MSDLISRQAAIDALRDAENHAFNSFYKGLAKAHKIIADLPSAQPEIIHCRDCTNYNAGYECLIEGYGIERDENYFCGSAERRTD